MRLIPKNKWAAKHTTAAKFFRCAKINADSYFRTNNSRPIPSFYTLVFPKLDIGVKQYFWLVVLVSAIAVTGCSIYFDRSL